MNRGNGHSSTGILPTPSHQEHHHQHHHEDGNDNEDDASIDSLEFVDQNGETNSINNNNSNSNNGGSDDTNLKADDIYDKLLDEIVKKITHKLN
ncbi:unnamed protein product [[Candida] boidinii]|nr:unnamed protein product [[Candida] boidinii]GMG00073.1 unnamed protein product [[Candida] boidinii]